MFFRLFSFLADKTGGWKIFVQPKIMLGTMILGFGVAACNSAGKTDDNNKLIYNDTLDMCYQGDTLAKCYEEVYIPPTKKAEFPGGQDALYKFLNENVQYPEFCVENNIQGKVFVNFLVEKNGKLSNIKIQRGVHKLFDDEVIRLVKLMPNWQPAERNDTLINDYFTLPVIFVLK